MLPTIRKEIVMSPINTLILLLIQIAASGNAMANPALLPEDPKRSVDKVSHDLNIKPEQFTACFKNVNICPRIPLAR